MEASLRHSLLVIDSITSPCLLPRRKRLGGGGTESLNLLITRLGPLLTSPSSQVLFQKQLTIEKETPLLLSTYEIWKALGTVCQKWRWKPNIYVSLWIRISRWLYQHLNYRDHPTRGKLSLPSPPCACPSVLAARAPPSVPPLHSLLCGITSRPRSNGL